ncbi:hypothetical protein ACWDGI_03960 [Streptomyces sp. NPDC001220]
MGLRLLGQDEVDGPAKCRPSAGGLYPVQTYLHVKPGAVTDLAPGAHYADPRRNTVVLLGEDRSPTWRRRWTGAAGR